MQVTHKRAVVKDILWFLLSVALVAAVIRYWRGLGATTALNDATPWGLWIGFDVMGGVALAAGGFTMAATVYIFQLEKYRPLVRPAILTAFLGYLSVIVGLLFDLGLPWHIWAPVVFWQHHSVMFEVAWCVMLYTIVLTLEFSLALLEHPWFRAPIFRTIARWLKRLIIPLVIVGVVLSTLHQSSLGSLALIMPFRLHPLWYSPILPVLFFVSAVALGLMMVTLEHLGSAALYGHNPRMDLLPSLGRVASWVLWGYVILRVGDLALRGVLATALDGSWQSILFWFEISLSALVPAGLLSWRSVRASYRGLLTAACLTVSGIILNRLSVSFIASYRTPGTNYFPSWLEFAVSLGIVAGAILVFIFFMENLGVFGQETADDPERILAYPKPIFDPATGVFQNRSFRDTVARRSLGALIAIAFAVLFLPEQALSSQSPTTPVRPALGWTTIRIDGNRNRVQVFFPHGEHQQRLKESVPAGQDPCVTCHHLSKPDDQGTGCAGCHRDMFVAGSMFNHQFHQTFLQGNASCVECHTGDHTQESAKPCSECHALMVPQDATQAKFNYRLVPSYKDAMHDTCMACHERMSIQRNKPDLPLCTTCHPPTENPDQRPLYEFGANLGMIDSRTSGLHVAQR